MLGTSNSVVALRIKGAVPKEGEKRVALRVGEKKHLNHPSARSWNGKGETFYREASLTFASVTISTIANCIERNMKTATALFGYNNKCSDMQEQIFFLAPQVNSLTPRN